MDNIKKAKELLVENDYTCVFCKDNEILCSGKRGVKPLIEFFETKKSFCGFSAADRVIGAGAAHMYVLLGIKEIWANVISKEGESILTRNNVCVTYEKKVPYIINRTGDGQCPIEKCVYGISDSKEAFARIKETLQALMQPDSELS